MIPFEIRGFPMPPSANGLYSNNSRTGGRHKSEKYSAYEDEVRLWMYKNNHQLDIARRMLQDLGHGEVLLVDRTYFFKAYRIISKAGKPLRNDTTNRIKALDDVLALILGIDDSYFWDGDHKKRPSSHVALGEYVDIKFSSIELPAIPEEA